MVGYRWPFARSIFNRMPTPSPAQFFFSLSAAVVLKTAVSRAFYPTVAQTNEDDPAYRATPDHRQKMLVEIMEEGTIRWNREVVDDAKRWLEVGTIVGEVRDDDDHDDDGGGGREEDGASGDDGGGEGEEGGEVDPQQPRRRRTTNCRRPEVRRPGGGG